MSNERLEAIERWAADMRNLFDKAERDEISLEKGETLANIAGKGLKAEALLFAREAFAENSRRRLPQIANGSDESVVATQ